MSGTSAGDPRQGAWAGEIGIGLRPELDVAGAYEDALAMAAAWLAFAASLERSGRLTGPLRADQALAALGPIPGAVAGRGAHRG